jgi:hypothetical protein
MGSNVQLWKLMDKVDAIMRNRRREQTSIIDENKKVTCVTFDIKVIQCSQCGANEIKDNRCLYCGAVFGGDSCVK